jgi:predicted nucleic acid-binding protein
MDKLVIDASVAVKWFVVEPYSNEARRVLNSYQSGRASFHAPDILPTELANTIWKKQLFQDLTEADAKDILLAFRRLEVTLVPAMVLLDDAYKLAITHRRSVYDALYLALSLREKCPLVTADEKFVNALTGFHSQVIWVGDWP